MFISTAPIIAAVTALSRQRKKQDENNSEYINNKDYLYKISFNLYLEFLPTKSVQHFTPEFLTKEESEIKKSANTKIVTIPDKSLCCNKIFIVYDSEVKGRISDYIRKNYEGFTSPIIWQPIKEEMIAMYLDWAETEYGIILERKNIKFNEKFTWNIQFDEKEFEEQCRINDEIDRDIESMKQYHKNRDPYFW